MCIKVHGVLSVLYTTLSSTPRRWSFKVSNVNLNQKVTPKTLDNYNERIDLYLRTGRITKKGEIFELLYEDHMEIERKRLFLETCSDISKELFITLERVQGLLIRETEHFLTQKERMEKEHRNQVAWRDNRISELEKIIQGYKKDLEEKIIENAEIKKGLERIRKREAPNNKKKVWRNKFIYSQIGKNLVEDGMKVSVKPSSL